MDNGGTKEDDETRPEALRAGDGARTPGRPSCGPWRATRSGREYTSTGRGAGSRGALNDSDDDFSSRESSAGGGRVPATTGRRSLVISGIQGNRESFRLRANFMLINSYKKGSTKREVYGLKSRPHIMIRVAGGASHLRRALARPRLSRLALHFVRPNGYLDSGFLVRITF